MLCTINNIPVVFPDPGGRLESWLAEHWPEIESQLQTIVCNYQRRQSGFGNTYGPGWREYPVYAINSLYWPTGFARRPFGFFLVHDSARTQMLAAATSAWYAYVRIDNDPAASTPTIAARLNFVCDGLQLVGLPNPSPLWIMVVSCQPTTVPYYTTDHWPTSDVATVPEYQALDVEVISSGRFSPAEIADLMGWSHNRRAVTKRRDAGQDYLPLTCWHAASESVSLHDSQISALSGLVTAGGVTIDGPVASQVSFRHPRSIQYHSNRHVGRVGNTPRNEWEANYPETEFTTFFPEVGTLSTYANYNYTPSTSRDKTHPAIVVPMSLPLSAELGNTSDLEDFHDQWLEDYLLWTSRVASIEFAGIRDWQSTGMDDYTIFECWPRPITRVVGLPPTARIGLNLANYAPTFDGDGNGFGSLSMPDIVTAYGLDAYSGSAAGGAPGAAANGTWYLRRSVPASDYVYTMAVQVYDPMNLLPDSGGDVRPVVFAVLAWFSNRWNIIQLDHVAYSVVTTARLTPEPFTDASCLPLWNDTILLKSPTAKVSTSTKHGSATACTYTGAGGGGGGGGDPPAYDPGAEWVYVGSGVWNLAAGVDPADVAPPGYGPPEPPSDWTYNEITDGTYTAYWHSDSTDYWLWIAP